MNNACGDWLQKQLQSSLYCCAAKAGLAGNMVTTSREATNTISTRMLLELGALIGKYNADD